jgi:hypothetical protein
MLDSLGGGVTQAGQCRSKHSKRASFTPSEAYRDCVPILKEKKGDLMDLRFISPVFHSFYREFPISSSSKGIHPDTAEDCLHNEGNMF